MKSRGFADLAALFEGTSTTSRLRQALGLVAFTVGLPALATGDLDRYLSAVLGSPSRLSLQAPIRARTGMDAEALADLLQSQLDICDRSHHFKKYPAYLVRTEAVQ